MDRLPPRNAHQITRGEVDLPAEVQWGHRLPEPQLHRLPAGEPQGMTYSVCALVARKKRACASASTLAAAVLRTVPGRVCT